jgi:hypothetical protein
LFDKAISDIHGYIVMHFLGLIALAMVPPLLALRMAGGIGKGMVRPRGWRPVLRTDEPVKFWMVMAMYGTVGTWIAYVIVQMLLGH